MTTVLKALTLLPTAPLAVTHPIALTIGGIVVLLLLILFIMMIPDIVRYIKISTM